MSDNNQIETKDKKAAKPEKKKGGSVFGKAANGVKRYFREARSEMKKIVWPTWKQVMNNTAIVLVAIVVVSVFIFLLDTAIQAVFNLII